MASIEFITIISGILILIISIVIHEVAHGYIALMWGDPTAKIQGRLTLNPISHLDPVGSFVVPFITMLMGVGAFGWAKPVPINVYNFKNQRWGEFTVALAGPASNLIIAVLFAIFVRLFRDDVTSTFLSFAHLVVYINVLLAIFNLMPFPPLDGSKILFTAFPRMFLNLRDRIERYSLILIFVAVFVIWSIVSPLVPIITNFLL